MSITNPEMKNGTGNTPDFLKVGIITIDGIDHWCGLRPIFEAAIMQGQPKFAIATGFRVRMEKMHSTDANASTSKLSLALNMTAKNQQSKKTCGHYGSYMIGEAASGDFDKDAYKTVAQAKSSLKVQVNCVLAAFILAGGKLDHTEEDIGLFMMTKLESIGAKKSIDIGDLASPDVPKSQPFVDKYLKNKASSGSVGQPSAKATPAKQVAPDPVPLPKAQADKYAEDNKADLGDLGFDDLMKQLGKKKD